MTYLLSSEAEEDIRNIVLYIAQDNKKAAERVAIHIEETMNMIADNPGVGSSSYHLVLAGTRFTSVKRYKNYLVFYRQQVSGNAVEILRVLHTARDIATLLGAKS